ncbi:MGH1-like glycoside hydrolase domain-containing protein [Anatilimnocola floriformis]|uniref:MGH1-like glycoside hydrolase domain-containing protein n=1 Tax=Anatilimnocola floriformis TaxID=2948575 RepID=UPI0020C32539|nr:glucosidase [Anatilimnocola floriformis]
MANQPLHTAESRRLEESAQRTNNWQRWGPYLSERQWGTVREDYSADGDAWDYFTHDQARSRAYRWGEDGLLGICDRQCRLCFGLALWNGHDPILKERLFGLTGPEGNHGEDVKECYYYLDSTPTHSYMKGLYKYPQSEFPYDQLVAENHRRGKFDGEYELLDTGVFDENRYFDVVAEYAKASPDDVLIRVTIANRGPEAAPIHVLPTLWFRNNWIWGCTHEGCEVKPRLEASGPAAILARHVSLGAFRLDIDPSAAPFELVFTDNETNTEKIFDYENGTHYAKDAFHEYVIHGNSQAVNPKKLGTKGAAIFKLNVPAGTEIVLRLRLTRVEEATATPFAHFDEVFATRISEADAFYAERLGTADKEASLVARQAYAGLLWSKQFYHYVVQVWLAGDPDQPPPPAARNEGRNHDWPHLFNRDVISMPDKWEYPWYAAWDLAFHMIPMAAIDPEFAKAQLELFLREWYLHPNGQIPAYEWALSDVNPPVHAWACWRVYKMTAPRGERDVAFLKRVFTKLLLNFTWWVNRKDVAGNHLFAGGFLGLDNIGVFDRSRPLPGGGRLEQADGTAWMAFYASTMLAMALELSQYDDTYEDIASKFFEHFVHIADAMNTLGGMGLWHEGDGFYYDQLRVGDFSSPLGIRSIVGIIPIFAAEVLEQADIDRLPGFKKRMEWFLKHRPDLARHIAYCDQSHQPAEHDGARPAGKRLLAIPSKERLERLLCYLLDESEFLSPYGIRALSRYHLDHPFVLVADGQKHQVEYTPAESTSNLFGGNSNWRGPIWFPINYLIIEALERYHHFYGDHVRVECPTGSGNYMNLFEASQELRRRLSNLFLPDATGRRACHGDDARYATDPHWRELPLFYEYFHGDNGRGVGANHQTGWTALIATILRDEKK